MLLVDSSFTVVGISAVAVCQTGLQADSSNSNKSYDTYTFSDTTVITSGDTYYLLGVTSAGASYYSVGSTVSSDDYGNKCTARKHVLVVVVLCDSPLRADGCDGDSGTVFVRPSRGNRRFGACCCASPPFPLSGSDACVSIDICRIEFPQASACGNIFLQKKSAAVPETAVPAGIFRRITRAKRRFWRDRRASRNPGGR